MHRTAPVVPVLVIPLIVFGMAVLAAELGHDPKTVQTKKIARYRLLWKSSQQLEAGAKS